MKYLLRSIKNFLTAEEVPRWFGLSLVLIYLVGLGAIAQHGMDAVRQESNRWYHRSARFAAEGLLRDLQNLDIPATDDAFLPGARVAMRRFTGHLDGASVAIYDGIGSLKIHAGPGIFDKSTPLNDFEQLDPGVLHSPETSRVETPSDRSTYELLARLPSPHGADPAGARLLRLSIQKQGVAAHFGQESGILLVAFIVLGALFLVYRCLREQLRNISRIAHCLRTHRASIEEDLNALRIADERDTATAAWNQLLDLAQDSMDQLRRVDADQELSRVLSQSGGGMLSDALHAVPDGIIVVTEEDRVEYANESACRLFGWDREKIRSIGISDVPDSPVGEAVVTTLRSSLQPEGRFLPANDVVRSGSVAGTEDESVYRIWILPVTRARHQGECLVIIRDITQQSRAERAREDLIAQVTHELRTPLTNIRAYSETLASGMFEDPQVVTECYNVINKETRRLSRLIEDMLNVSQMEVGSIDLNYDQVDLKIMLSDAVQDVRGLADEKNIELQLLLPAKLETVRADRDKLAVVINNLLGNAIKYTLDDGHVIIGCQTNQDAAIITIKDNGVGIDESEQGKIFEKFYRVNDENVQAETGTGIGLYTSREIVRRHGGEIELISAKGEGSTFMVRLPHEGGRSSQLDSSTAAEAGV